MIARVAGAAGARMCRFRSAFTRSVRCWRGPQARGIAVNWAGSGATTPSVLQLELIERLKPTIWTGMSSYGLHFANLAEARGLDLAARSVETVLCSAEPLSDAKRESLRANGARRSGTRSA